MKRRSPGSKMTSDRHLSNEVTRLVRADCALSLPDNGSIKYGSIRMKGDCGSPKRTCIPPDSVLICLIRRYDSTNFVESSEFCSDVAPCFSLWESSGRITNRDSNRI